MQNILTLIALAGIIIEAAEYAIFLFLGTEIAHHFFPHQSSSHSLLMTLGIFAAGYLFRPLGAFLYGTLADTRGRRKAMLLSVCLAGLATITIGLLPTYQSIGFAAPLGLLLLRILQCMAIAGEFNNASIYLMEHTHDKKTFAAALAGSMGPIGMCIGGLLAYFVSLSHWQESWRIPFLVLGSASLLLSFYRSQLLESPLFLQLQKQQQLSHNPIKQAFTFYKFRLFLILALCAFLCVSVYICGGTFYTYLAKVSPLGSSQTKLYASMMQLEMAIFMPIVGWYSSLFLSSYRLFMIGALSMAAMSIVMFMVATTQQHWVLLSVLTLYAWTYAMGVTAVLRLLYDLVPTVVRCTSVCVLYNFAAATFGGTAPLIAQTMLNHGLNYGPSLYVVFITTITMGIMFISENSYLSETSLDEEAPQCG